MFARALAKRQVRKKFELDGLPSFPALVADGLRMLRSPDTALTEVGHAIAADPGISAKLLRMANSTAFALRHPVRSVPHAVSLLGRGTVESMLLATMVAAATPKVKDAAFDARAFWGSAARRALMARAIARDVHSGHDSEAFTEALLHDMAVPFLLKSRGDKYRAVLVAAQAGEGSLVTLEREALGYDHAEVAGWMAEHWEFPQPLVNALAAHHEVSDTPGGFVASYEGCEDEAFVEAGIATFDVPDARVKGWLQAAEDAGELASALASG